ncbi:MAG TPA: succinylglutamate desuccinylase/aspartoacylase family protein [bacterium]|nr:succinylglutamate desuccinylase/aspartoacylase family protein [bacterium]
MAPTAKRDTLTIGTCTSAPGQTTNGLLPAGTTPTRKPIYVPVTMVTGLRPGPVVGITAGVHGDEVSGMETVLRFLAELDPHQVAGTVVIAPVLNPTGYRHNQRNVFEDDTDLNRVFPGRKEGSTAEQVAFHLFEHLLRKLDFAIDIHDAGKLHSLLPHTRINVDDQDHCTSCTREMGLLYGTELVLERSGAAGMMAIEARRLLRLPVLTVEVGGANNLRDHFIERGLRGLRNFLISQGMLEGELELPEFQFALKERTGIPAPLSGIIRFHANLGDGVAKGDVLADIRDPLTGRLETVEAPGTGVVFSRKMAARVEEGDSIGSVLEFEHSSTHGAWPVDGELIDNRQRNARLYTSQVMEAALRLISGRPQEVLRQAAE